MLSEIEGFSSYLPRTQQGFFFENPYLVHNSQLLDTFKWTTSVKAYGSLENETFQGDLDKIVLVTTRKMYSVHSYER